MSGFIYHMTNFNIGAILHFVRVMRGIWYLIDWKFITLCPPFKINVSLECKTQPSCFCAAVYQWCGFKSRRRKNKNFTPLISNPNTVWFNFQTHRYIYIYIYIYINKVYTIDTLQHQSFSLMSSALDHSTTSTPWHNGQISHFVDKL
jgi:hypothetical protein